MGKVTYLKTSKPDVNQNELFDLTVQLAYGPDTVRFQIPSDKNAVFAKSNSKTIELKVHESGIRFPSVSVSLKGTPEHFDIEASTVSEPGTVAKVGIYLR